MDKVSVVIPFHKDVDSLIEALDSVYRQTYTNFEVIIINDGSTESDEQIRNLVSERSDTRYISLGENMGPAAARNHGIEAANGEYIAFLDSDDVWRPDKLNLQVSMMKDNDWAISHTSYQRNDHTNGSKSTIHSGKRTYTYPGVAFRCLIATPTVVIRRNALADHRFSESYRYGEDVLLWTELSRHYPIHGIDIVLAEVNTDSDTASRNKEIKLQVLDMLSKEALSGHYFYQFVHRLYRSIRAII